MFQDPLCPTFESFRSGPVSCHRYLAPMHAHMQADNLHFVVSYIIYEVTVSTKFTCSGAPPFVYCSLNHSVAAGLMSIHLVFTDSANLKVLLTFVSLRRAIESNSGTLNEVPVVM